MFGSKNSGQLRWCLAALCFVWAALWVGVVHAASGGIPACQAKLTAETGLYDTCNSNLTVADGSLSTCNTNLTAETGLYNTCHSNLTVADVSLSTCNTNLTLETGLYNTCNSNLTVADGSLSTCNSNLTAAQLNEQCEQSILNGSTTCVNLNQGFFGGTLKCGSGGMIDTSGCFAKQFTDNGDGTVTDHKTGLMWEQATGTVGTILTSPPVTDVNNTYTWSSTSSTGTAPDGTAFTSFLVTLNNGASVDGGATTAITGCFANHCDWRLPSIVELQGIVNTSDSPSIDPIFGPTQSYFYWSATTSAGDPGKAWFVALQFNGGVGPEFKIIGFYVRAVRSGL